MAIDLTTDYRFLLGTRTVTHTHKTASGNTADSVAYALKQSVKIQDAAGAWILSATACLWFLPGPELSNAPKEGDTITDGGEVWTIQDAAQQPLTAMWQCQCVKER